MEQPATLQAIGYQLEQKKEVNIPYQVFHFDCIQSHLASLNNASAVAK